MRGINRPSSLKERTTWVAERTWRKVSKIRAIRPWTSMSGCLKTRFRGSRIRPTGRVNASSPRSGLVEEPGGQAASDRMQLQFRDLALQAQEQAAVDRGRVVDPVAIGDEAVAVAADVEQRIPVGAVAGEPGDFGGEDDPHLFECEQGHEFLKALTSLGGAGGSALIRVDDPDLVLVPAEFEGALLEGVLEPGALLVGQGLVGAGLADVDDRQAARGGAA